MPPKLVALTLVVTAFVSGLRPGHAQDALEYARSRMGALRYEVYATSRQVEALATDSGARTRAWTVIRRMGITKVYLEVYRSGHLVPGAHLIRGRDWLGDRGIDVVGGIATVPGGSFGVRQQGPLQWFNWQNPKTQNDVREVIRAAAGIFDTFIVDDFLCTGDLSEESRAAKGTRSWGEYRRDLISDVARSVVVGPAKEVNPSITMIVKYPQWYDRFHRFGYDTETLPRIFDRVWVGTETRGRTTQRFGFVQPYEGFVNYRWLADMAPRKIGGAWFDHGDCREHDFLDQAYMSVLAGARELVFFNLGDLEAGHPDHGKIVAQFDQLADLAAAVGTHPVTGIPAYKPPNSDPAGDMYLIDFLGMLGIPLVPVHQFPDRASVIFLPAQAAADPLLLEHVRAARARGAHLIVTASLLSISPQARPLAKQLGLRPDYRSQPRRARVTVLSPKTGQRDATEVTVDLESPLEVVAGPEDIVCTAEGRHYPLLYTSKNAGPPVAILNTHTFSQADFDAVGEVLLCPRPLGLLGLEGQPLRALRAAFRGQGDVVLEGPSCVTLHRLGGETAESYVLQNYNERDVSVSVTVRPGEAARGRFRDVFTDRLITARASESAPGETLDLRIPARGRVWIARHPPGEDSAVFHQERGGDGSLRIGEVRRGEVSP